MPQANSASYTTTGAKPAVILDEQQSPFNASVAAIVVGSGTYGVEYTFDDVNNAAITPVWFPDVNLPAGQVASAVSNYMFPIRAVRINITVIGGAGIRFVVLQGTQQL